MNRGPFRAPDRVAPGAGATGPVAPAHADAIEPALGLVPSDVFVMTARHDQARLGVIVTRVVRCADAPPCVSVALLKGHPVSPLIRDSRAFALCALARGERVLARMFERPGSAGTVVGQGASSSPTIATSSAPRPTMHDPFLSLDVECLETGAPVLRRSRYALDCRVVMHLDFESDHELYIGQVVGAKLYETPAPAAPKGRNGKA